VEGSLPARLIEDVKEDVSHEADALADALLIDLVGWCFEGPVDEHGAANDVFARDETPETTVETFGAIVAHGEDLAGGNDEVAVDDVAGQFVSPACGDLIVRTGRDVREVVAVGVERVLHVAVFDGHRCLRLVLSNAVEINDSVAEVNAVAGDADGALDEEEIRLAGLEEDDDVAPADVTIEGEGRPFGGRGEGDAVDEDVVADEESPDHRGGGDLEVLEDEGHDEEADGEDSADGGEGLERSLGLILPGCFSFVWFGCYGVGQDGSPEMQLTVYR
jgi:hypothetical protein